MKKSIPFYFIYLVIIWGYFLFLYPLESYSDTRYAAIAHAVYFSKLPLEWLILYFMYKHPAFQKLTIRLTNTIKYEWLQAILFSLVLVSLYGLVRLPFNLIWFQVTHREGTSIQPFSDWLLEMGLDLLFYWVILAAGMYVLRKLMKKFKHYWWFMLWLLALPIAVFVVYVQPVWIDPLYEDFAEMEEGPLKSQIEGFVEELGLEDATLLQVNMSEKVTTFNAYVTGIFGNARIVLWDTTLSGMESEEILFILAHEIGHYVKNHVYKGVAGYLVLSFFLFYFAAIIFRRLTHAGGYRDQRDWRAIALLLFIVSVLLTISQPVSMYVSRQIETSADRYAIQHTENLSPAIESYQRMAIQSKSDIDPVFWVKWMRYSHSPIKERMELVEEEIRQRQTKSD